MEKDISLATANNWKRLNVKNVSERLKSRANKSRSEKKFIPMEYLSNRENIQVITDILKYIETEELSMGEVLHSLGINLLLQNAVHEVNQYARDWMNQQLDET